MFERRNVLEATVGKWNAEVALSWCAPAESAAETVEVVVVREAAQRALGLCQAGEPMSVEDLALKYLPEGLNLAVGQGVEIWVRRCRMLRSRSRFPNRVRTPGIQTTKGLPLSLMSTR